MTLKSRVILIICGIIIFLIAAPLSIFLARGFRYDFSQNRLVKTGALVIKTDPRGAEVKLRGQTLSSGTPLTQRFLLPGEYDVEIKKPGYFTWKKQVTIHEQFVTYLSRDSERIFLLLQNPAQTSVSTSTPLLNPQKTYKDQYYISADKKHLLLKNPGGGSGEDLKLAGDLPQFGKSEILAGESKQIFLLLDDRLFEVREKLQILATGVSYARFDNESRALIYGNEHEIWLYRPLKRGEAELVTRSSAVLGLGVYNGKIGYVFVAEGTQIKAIEFDSSGGANVYTLAETNTPGGSLLVNPQGTELTYLDGEELISLKIR